MQRQVHEDVDAVLADQLGDLLVGEAHDVPPDVGQDRNRCGDVVGAEHVGVAEDLELSWSCSAKQRQEIAARPRGRGNRARRSRSATGDRASGRWRGAGSSWPGARRTAGSSGGAPRRSPGVVAGTEMERVEEVAVGLGKVRLQFQCPAVAGDRFVQLPLVLQGIAQVVRGPRHSRVSVPVPGGSRRPLRPASPGP